MKKKLVAVLCALTMTFGLSVTALANDTKVISPSATPSTDSETKKSADTGEGNGVIYGLAAALLLGGTAVISKKKLEEAR